MKRYSNLEHKIGWVVVIFLCVAIVGYFFNLFYMPPQPNSQDFFEFEQNFSKNNSVAGDGIISDEPIWQRMPLRFYINDSGDELPEIKKQKIKNFWEATERLHEAVQSIFFINVDTPERADIIFAIKLPREYYDLPGDGTTSTAGLMVPVDNGSVRVKAYIYDTVNNHCLDSNVALHELLHSFNVGHSKNSNELMSVEFVDCDKGFNRPNLPIKQETIDYLESIYG